MFCASFTNARRKGIAFVENQVRLRRDEGGAFDSRMDHVVDHRSTAFKNTANDAFLPPDLALFQLSICDEAGKFGARACAARRTVVSVTRTKNEVFTVYAGES